MMVTKEMVEKLHTDPDYVAQTIKDIVEGFHPNRAWAQEKASKFVQKLKEQTADGRRTG